MGLNDLMIAAHALTINATLVSADAAFARVPGLQVENWLQMEAIRMSNTLDEIEYFDKMAREVLALSGAHLALLIVKIPTMWL